MGDSHPRLPMLESGCCPECGYDLCGSHGPLCPECGRQFDRAKLIVDPDLKRVRRRVVILSLLMFAMGILAGLYRSVVYWAGPSPSWKFLVNTDQSRILKPALLGPPVLGCFGFFITIPVLLVAGALIFFGTRRKQLWALALAGFALLAGYWYFLVEVAWSID